MNKFLNPNKVFKIEKKHFLLLLASAFATGAQAQEVPQLFADNNVDNTQIDTSQAEQIIFDIYAAGRYQGNALVSYNDEWVVVENPNDILDQMPKVKNIQAFAQLFKGKIFTNKEKSVSGVGSVQVDPYNFKLSITIAPEQATKQQQQNNIPTLQASTANHVSLANRLRLTGSTDFEPNTDDSFGLYHSLAISRGGWRTFMTGNLVKSEGYDFNSLYAAHDVGRNIYGIGMLQTSGAKLVGSENIYGVTLQSNIRGYGDLSELSASPIDIFVPSQARVRIYRESTDQLIYTADHAFGLQTISTARFPTGSYEIRIEIDENNGTITEEKRFFNKSNRLAPIGLPEYSMALGIQRDGVEMGSAPVYQFRYATRVMDNLEFNANLYGVDGAFVLEPELSGFYGNGYSYDAALSMTSNNDLAFIGGLSYVPIDKDDPITWYMRYTQTLTGHQYSSNDIEDDDLFKQNTASARSVFSGNITYRLPTVSWSFSAKRSKYFRSESTYSYGPSVNWRLYYKNGHQITANAQLAKTRSDTNQGVFVNYRYKPRDSKWDYKNSVGRQNTGVNNFTQVNQDITYDGREGGKFGTTFKAGHNAQIENDRNTRTSTLYLTQDMKHVGFSGNYQRINSSNRPKSQTFDYKLDSDILITQDDFLDPEKRDVFVAGSRAGQSNNIIVTVKGNATGEPMDININGIRKTTARVGEKVAFDVPDYSGAELTITPSDDSVGLLDFDPTPMTFKLYPGNIAQKEWTVNRIYLLSGRAVSADGKPLAWQRIEGAKNYATTDQDGFFQMELLGNETPFINTSKHQCVLALPILKKEQQYVQVGDIVCG